VSSPSSPRLVVPVRATAFLVMPAPSMHLRPVQPCPSETCSPRPSQSRISFSQLEDNAAPPTRFGARQSGARYELARLSMVAVVACQGVNPNSQNVRLMVGTPSLHSGKVVVGSTTTLAAGERTTFSLGLVPNRPEMSLVRFPPSDAFRAVVSGNIYHNAAKAGNAASLSANSNEVQAVIP
jgi:hypothetical protein